MGLRHHSPLVAGLPASIPQVLLARARAVLEESEHALVELKRTALFSPRWLAKAERHIDLLRAAITQIQSGAISWRELAEAVERIQGITLHARLVLDASAAAGAPDHKEPFKRAHGLARL